MNSNRVDLIKPILYPELNKPQKNMMIRNIKKIKKLEELNKIKKIIQSNNERQEKCMINYIILIYIK